MNRAVRAEGGASLKNRDYAQSLTVTEYVLLGKVRYTYTHENRTNREYLGVDAVHMDQIIQGDCVSVLKTFSDESIDLTVTSPPYDNIRSYNKTLDWDVNETIRQLYRVTKNGGVVVWVVGDQRVNGSRTLTSFQHALSFKEVGFLVEVMIYQKKNPMPFIQKDCYTPSFEYIFVMSKGKKKTFNPIMEDCKYAGITLSSSTSNKESMRTGKKTVLTTKAQKIKSNVFAYSCAGTNFGHPAVFPPGLARDMILSYSNEKDLVLDPFAGSGTVGVDCKKLNRDFILIEKEPEYVHIAKQRLEKLYP